MIVVVAGAYAESGRAAGSCRWWYAAKGGAAFSDDVGQGYLVGVVCACVRGFSCCSHGGAWDCKFRGGSVEEG